MSIRFAPTGWCRIREIALPNPIARHPCDVMFATASLVNCDAVNPLNLLWASLSRLLQTPSPESLMPLLEPSDDVARNYDAVSMHHPSETIVFHNEDGNPARANIKQALGYLKDGDGDGNSQPHKGVKASANSDVMYSFTSAQDGDPLQDDVRLCLGDDLKKAQDHSQRQAGDLP
ncbi:hypothetical protein Tco_1019300 [Tanacetum coccineum]|uniref:Uncharacterized protein n=1 Tax=Tanacetum coccineum TaxID=301880 RepID=A0ABQ5FWV2_9ASTR